LRRGVLSQFFINRAKCIDCDYYNINYKMRYYMSFKGIVEEWDVWPQGPRLQGEDEGKAGARESNKTTEQSNNRTSTRHRNIINIHQNRT
jgi:hypothetical protein